MAVSFPIYDKLNLKAMRFHIDNTAAKACRDLVYDQSDAPEGKVTLDVPALKNNLNNLKHLPYSKIWVEGFKFGPYPAGYLVTQDPHDNSLYIIEYAIVVPNRAPSFSVATIFINLEDENSPILLPASWLLKKGFSEQVNERLIGEVASDCWAILSYITSFLAMLHTKQFFDERKVVHEHKDVKYLEKLAAKGKEPPQKDYIVVSLSERAIEHRLHMQEKKDGIGKCMHHRRGHFRRAFNKIFWISPCIVGSKGELKQKDYIVRA